MKITEILKAVEVEGKYGMQTRTAFKVEGNEHTLSAFSKYPLKVGQEIDGTISTTEKEGRTYYNFKFAPRDSRPTAPSANTEAMLQKIFNEVYATRVSLQSMYQYFQSKGELPPKVDYPVHNGEPDFEPKDDEIKPEDIPF